MISSNILCTICARGGSKGVLNKNTKELLGTPLIAHTINQARESRMFDHIVVSTDSESIAAVATKYGAEVFFKRDAYMASDSAGKVQVIRDAFVKSEEYYSKKYDYLIDLDATAPLRKVEDILNAFDQFVRDNNNNLITAMLARRSPYFNLVEIDKAGQVHLSKVPEKPILRRQDSPLCYDLNASIYIWKRESILNDKAVFTENTGLFIMPEERSIDLDSELDFEFIEFIMKKNSK